MNSSPSPTPLSPPSPTPSPGRSRRGTWTAIVAGLVVAVAVLGGFGSMASKLGDVQENDIASWLPGDAESTKVIERTAGFASDDESPAIVVFVRDSGITAADVVTVRGALAELQDLDENVVSAVAPAVLSLSPAEQQVAATAPAGQISDDLVARLTSQDGTALQLVVTYRIDDTAGFEQLPDAVDAMREVVASSTGGGLQGYVGGPLAFGADQATAFAGIDGILLLAALSVVVVMLLLTYRSPFLWLIPLVCGVLSVGAAEGVVYLLARYADLTVNGQSAGILAVLVLGAGIDYALLLVARYREELRNFEHRIDAMSHALRRAAPAIVASGLTVVIGLLCLSFAQMNSTAGLGPVTAAGIVVALLVMLIVLPLLLVVFGRWVFWPFVPRFGDVKTEGSGLWGRVGTRVARRPRTVWVTTTVLLGLACVGMTQLNSGLLSNADTFTTEQPSIVADEVIADHFPAGEGSPVQVVARAADAGAVAAALDDTDGLQPASASAAPGSPESQDGLVRGDVVYFERTLTAASDSEAAYDTVERAREAVHAVDGADAQVGGISAIGLDVRAASAADNQLIIPLILLVVLVVLGVLLRSILAPLILLGTVVLSFGAALGISAVVFQQVFDFAGTDTSFPLFAFVFLVALGIDYNIFLMTRVREESVKIGTRRGALIGLAATGGVITSAGLVLAGTFSALATLPIVFLAQLGFVVALGVLLDTIVVRSVLVTALTLDVGRWMWWPSHLWRTDGSHHVADAGHAADPVDAAPARTAPEHRA
ncbi:MMPL family transporter [Aeromicrobium sp.]|uniref:MMPL family transporter n=1 Tax=Aeromicrobium sp. TaxID=1871063 RepID=UPI0025C6963E|nr:MMPL family transporter [Aeromicrobium sp.]MCK5890219.1 MMPL family transporter [Aeromicrobium sp.]